MRHDFPRVGPSTRCSQSAACSEAAGACYGRRRRSLSEGTDRPDEQGVRPVMGRAPHPSERREILGEPRAVGMAADQDAIAEPITFVDPYAAAEWHLPGRTRDLVETIAARLDKLDDHFVSADAVGARITLGPLRSRGAPRYLGLAVLALTGTRGQP